MSRQPNFTSFLYDPEFLKLPGHIKVSCAQLQATRKRYNSPGFQKKRNDYAAENQINKWLEDQGHVAKDVIAKQDRVLEADEKKFALQIINYYSQRRSDDPEVMYVARTFNPGDLGIRTKTQAELDRDAAEKAQDDAKKAKRSCQHLNMKLGGGKKANASTSVSAAASVASAASSVASSAASSPRTASASSSPLPEIVYDDIVVATVVPAQAQSLPSVDVTEGRKKYVPPHQRNAKVQAPVQVAPRRTVTFAQPTVSSMSSAPAAAVLVKREEVKTPEKSLSGDAWDMHSSS
jgi:hypothetical protein